MNNVERYRMLYKAMIEAYDINNLAEVKKLSNEMSQLKQNDFTKEDWETVISDCAPQGRQRLKQAALKSKAFQDL